MLNLSKNDKNSKILGNIEKLSKKLKKNSTNSEKKLDVPTGKDQDDPSEKIKKSPRIIQLFRPVNLFSGT